MKRHPAPREGPRGLSSPRTRATGEGRTGRRVETPTSAPPLATPKADEPIAIIDLGSNSGRIVSYVRDTAGHLRILASSRAALRLVQEVDKKRRLGEGGIARALDALRDFRAVALGAGARRIIAVATAAMREASDAPAFLRRVRDELDIKIRVIDSEAEGRYGFLGGVRALPVESGLFFDMGGGSLQLSRFEHRRLLDVVGLPLGALRLSSTFLKSDPPRNREIRRVQSHVRELLEAARIAPLLKGHVLVGAGGTIRNLAKIDREGRRYPIARIHGYVLKRRRLARLAAFLADAPADERARVPGLSRDRADSIVGGAFAVDALMGVVGADRVLLSGLGIREGLAHSLWSDEVPDVGAVQESSLASLSSRFWGVDRERSARRVGLAASLAHRLLATVPGEIVQALLHAARLVDVGRSVDFFDRYRHAAAIVLETDLDGFSHRQIALISGVIRCADDGGWDPTEHSPLLRGGDREAVRRAGVILALADEIEVRCPTGEPAALKCRVSKLGVSLKIPTLAGWRPRGLGVRFERVFGRRLSVGIK
jgi:exopolyphosphatase/guanosine-5'-triphosphate,3'-diphosphate pyrophosphatase